MSDQEDDNNINAPASPSDDDDDDGNRRLSIEENEVDRSPIDAQEDDDSNPIDSQEDDRVHQEGQDIATPDEEGDSSPQPQHVSQERDDGEEEQEVEGPSSPVSPKDEEDDSEDEEIRKLEAQAADSDDEHEEKPITEEPEEEDEEKKVTREDGDDDEQQPSTQPEVSGVDGKLIADIFGESDSEDEEFEGFKKEDILARQTSEGQSIDKKDDDGSSSSSDDEDREKNRRSDIVYDFDLMMQKKREENYRKRKRKDIDIINDADDIIANMITLMKQAADDDFNYNKEKKPATCKLKLLSTVEAPIRKIDYRESLLESGILSVITDWLTPLPDRSLPNIRVREVMLRALMDFNISDTERLKASGIGKAVMYLYKHPKETKENKSLAHRLIQAWSRPIFNNDTDFHSITKEEREARDVELLSRAKRNRSSSTSEPTPKKQERIPQPGDPDFVPRARVPMPALKGYVNRPKPSPDVDGPSRSGSGKKAVTRLDIMQRSFKEKQRANRTMRAVKISIEGRRM